MIEELSRDIMIRLTRPVMGLPFAIHERKGTGLEETGHFIMRDAPDIRVRFVPITVATLLELTGLSICLISASIVDKKSDQLLKFLTVPARNWRAHNDVVVIAVSSNQYSISGLQEHEQCHFIVLTILSDFGGQ